MSDIPEGAQRSEDGQWWWDGNQWQSVSGQGGSLQEREAARVAAGLPAKLEDLTDDHRKPYIAASPGTPELVSAGEAEVLAMNDSGSDSEGSVA
jgi:hypothetical protein